MIASLDCFCQSQKELERIKGDQTEKPMFAESRQHDSHDEAVVLTSMKTFKPDDDQQAETHAPTDHKENDVNVEIEDNYKDIADNIDTGYVSNDKEDEPDHPDDVRVVATPLGDGDTDMSDLGPDARRTLKVFFGGFSCLVLLRNWEFFRFKLS